MNTSSRSYAFAQPTSFGIVLAILSAVWPALAVAAPQITGVSGSLQHGQELVIKGSNFGAKSPALPYLYIPFGEGMDQPHPTLSIAQVTVSLGELVDRKGNVMVDLSGDGDSGGSSRSGSPTVVAPGSVASQRRWYGGSYSNDQLGTQLHFQGSPKRIYTWWKMYTTWQARSGPATHNFKFHRVFADGPKHNYFLDDRIVANVYMDGANKVADHDTSGNWSLKSGTWWTMELEHEVSDPSQANGRMNYFMNGKINNTRTNVTHRSTAESQPHNAMFWLEYHRGQSASDYVFFDSVYADDTLARVIISDSPQWDTKSASLNEIQIPVSWNGNEIRVSLRQGALGSLGGAYLYVFDANGNVNSKGFPLAGCGGCPRAPTIQ